MAALGRAARSLATIANTHANTSENTQARTVGIVTGFCVTSADPPSAETDGPPGALFLAEVLRALGMNVILVSDRYGVPLLRAGVEHCRLSGVEIVECPLGSGRTDDVADKWCKSFLRDGSGLRDALGQRLTHLVSIERAGPSHTPETIRQQAAAKANTAKTNSVDTNITDTIVDRFVQTVPAADHGRCHNMRGEVIDLVTAPLHRLFDSIAAQRLPIMTVGIGDGGNEIGMGALPWHLLSELTDPRGGSAGRTNLLSRVACRVTTDHTIVAGVSNWGGFALALAVAAMRGLAAAELAGAVDRQADLVETLVASAGAVDGFSGRCEPLVDGLDHGAHLSPLTQMYNLLFAAS